MTVKVTGRVGLMTGAALTGNVAFKGVCGRGVTDGEGWTVAAGVKVAVIAGCPVGVAVPKMGGESRIRKSESTPFELSTIDWPSFPSWA